MGSRQSAKTETKDQRLVVDSGAFGNTGTLTAGDVTLNSADSELVKTAYEFLNKADATVTERANKTLSSAENTADNFVTSGLEFGKQTQSLGYAFANDLLTSAEKAREDSFKAGSDAVSSAFNAVSDLSDSVKGQTFDYSQIVGALIAAGALFLVTKH